ncbi:hypothetical protein EUTSA_v10026953mg [Eutrema salsugineum]|uniref:Uncharacterized protein n=1 Tax=Eutrema salsugineum TaxID=72664 RepID=V4MLK8_EUTSA|nr:hypothetical protein EUTSA_v10026953mg [Eutrema salsugineum]
MVILDTIPETFTGNEQISDLKQFCAEIDLRFASSDKAEISSLLYHFSTMREYILEMSDIVSKLKTLKIELPEEVLIHFVLKSLPPQFNQLKSSYNTRKEKWALSELISYCVSKGDRMKQERSESAHMVNTSKVNLIEVPRNTWWLDSGATTNIIVSLQGCLSYQKPTEAEDAFMWLMVLWSMWRLDILPVDRYPKSYNVHLCTCRH